MKICLETPPPPPKKVPRKYFQVVSEVCQHLQDISRVKSSKTIIVGDAVTHNLMSTISSLEAALLKASDLHGLTSRDKSGGFCNLL